jgi:CheY-like chemotaxis protein
MPDMDGFSLAREIRASKLLSPIPILILSSATRSGDSELCKEIGIVGYLTKPIRQSSLLDSILLAVHSQQVQRKTSPNLEMPRIEPGARVLLAEDNLVNQKLAERLLLKHGFTVQIAKNGLEAVAAWRNGKFDLVLMDVQMPEMDGFEATSEIRQHEKATGTRIPIVALTAHAMKGDEERCLEAGMDAYVSKPIQPHHLFSTISSLLNRRA